MPSMRRLLAASLLLAAPRLAWADPPRARLAWVRADGAERCPDASVLRRSLAARLGRDAIADDAPFSFEVVASREAPSAPWSASVFVRDASGSLLAERRLTAPTDDCAALTDAVALALAVTLDDAPPDAPVAPPVVAPPPPSPAPPPAPPPPARAPVARRWRFAARALGGIAVAIAAAPSPVVGVRVELTPPRGPRLYAGASWITSSTSAFAPGEVGVSIAGASLGLCPLVARTGSLDLALCAGVFAGTLTAEGRGFVTNRAETLPYVALEAAPTARWNLSRHLDLSATLEALVPLIRDRLVVDGVGEAFQPAAIGLRGTIGVGLHFE
jgi:hypothetical protein